MPRGIKRVRDACFQNKNKIYFDFSDSFWVTIKTSINKNVPENVPEKRLHLIIEIILQNNKTTIKEFASKLKVTTKTIQRDLDKLKKDKYIKRIGADKGGYWEVLRS